MRLPKLIKDTERKKASESLTLEGKLEWIEVGRGDESIVKRKEKKTLLTAKMDVKLWRGLNDHDLKYMY